MIETLKCRAAVAAAALLLGAAALARWRKARAERSLRTGDYIVAVVNQELVTASEVEQRIGRMRDEARAQRRPPAAGRRRCASRCSTR